MSDKPLQRYYASRVRPLVWILITLLLARAAWFYLDREWYVAAVICGLWVLLGLSWAVGLLTTPIVAVYRDRLAILERMIFGRPRVLVLPRKELTGVGKVTPSGIELFIDGLGSRDIGLKQLRKTDREAAKAAIRRFVEG